MHKMYRCEKWSPPAKLKDITALDFEAIVAKLKYAAYGEGWFKIRNRGYSQYEDGQELFEKRMAVAR